MSTHVFSDLPDRLVPFARNLMSGPIPHLGQRYDTAGTFLRERGNTVVCHLFEGSEAAAAITDARSRFTQMPGADKLAFTAASSLHMTLFQGSSRRGGRCPTGRQTCRWKRQSTT